MSFQRFSRAEILHVLVFCDGQSLCRLEMVSSKFGTKFEMINSKKITICEIAAMNTCIANSRRKGHSDAVSFDQTWKRQLWLCWETSPLCGLLPAKESVLDYNLETFCTFLDSCRVSVGGMKLCEKNEVDGQACAMLEKEDLVDMGMSNEDVEVVLQIKTWLSDLHHPHEHVGSHVVLRKMIEDRKKTSQREKSCHVDDVIWEFEEELPYGFTVEDSNNEFAEQKYERRRSKILERSFFEKLRPRFTRRGSGARSSSVKDHPRRRRFHIFPFRQR